MRGSADNNMEETLPTEKKPNNKLFIISIAVFAAAAIILGVLYFVIIKQVKPAQQTSPAVNLKQETPNMMLSFVPNILKVSPGKTISANIAFDSFGNSVDKIYLVVSYDPSKIGNVELSAVEDPSSALSFSFNIAAGIYTNDPALGITSVTFMIPKNIPPAKGHGIIAKITATLKPDATATTLKISPSSSVNSRTLSKVILGRVNLDINPAE